MFRAFGFASASCVLPPAQPTMRRLVLSCILPFHSRLLAPVASPVALPMAATRSFSASNTLSESLLSIESAGTSSAAPSDGLKPSLVVLVGCTGSGKSKLVGLPGPHVSCGGLV